MAETSFRHATLILLLSGIVYQVTEYLQDMYIAENFGHSRYGMLLVMNHFLMGIVLGCLMILTYIKAKRSQYKCKLDLHHSEKQFSVIFENSPLGMIYFDQTGTITKVNNKYLEIFDAPRERVIGFNMLSQLQDINLQSAVKSALLGQITCYEGPYTSVISDKTLYLKVVFKGLTSESGEFFGGIGMYEDISEKKMLDKELARLDRLELVGQMSVSIGHEIRNPMTSVKGFLQLLGNRELDLTKKEYYEIMISELDRANTIITDFVALSKDKKVELEIMSINEIIDTIFPLILVDALEQDKNINLIKGVVPKIPLDESEIRQLIFNLVRNGLEAMPKGKNLTIRTYSENEAVVMEIQDEGPGIRTDVIERLGTPFLTTKETGTGLGLPVCYSIVERHRGKINFKTGSSGTSFYVWFSNAMNEDQKYQINCVNSELQENKAS